MTFNGPPAPSPESLPGTVETPEYWKENLQFVYPKRLYETEFAFAKLMAGRQGISVFEAVEKYAPLVNKAIRTEDKDKTLLPGITEENLLEAGYEEVLERRKSYSKEGLTYQHKEENRFGCFYYRYQKDQQAIALHFFNAEAEEEFINGKDMSKGPLSKEKFERRRHELKDMFTDIKERYPDVKYVVGRSNLYNVEAYRRLYPDTYEVGDIDYDPELWAGNTDIWGQFLGGNDKEPGQYGFKDELAQEFLKKAESVPLDRLADALPNPPRTARGDIQDFYDLYGIE